ncbi:MAG: FAD-binding protein [Syntrophorhabdaceae bacterium]|nr:FAD-binding protein [Syntrophorhabdales bacterium]MBP9560627.1 FAD-binding protein [Syntrophorhabdaceae bacterium]
MLKESVINELQGIVGKENVLTSPEALRTYSYDGTTSWIHEPDVVVFPHTTEEVSGIMKLANREKIPVTPRGGGTNVSGGSVPIMGGIVLCTTKMNKILNIDKENLSVTVEPGVVLMDLNMRLAKEGLFFPPDPQSFLGATLGGVMAENGGGPACVKYGVTKQYVLGLQVVLPTGDIINVGGRTIKNVVGYDLPMLFIGSEGTLGVITRGELKVSPLPPTKQTIMAVYGDIVMAGETVFRVLEHGVIPSKIELIDNWVINRIEEMMPLGLPKDAEAVLLFECDGIPETVEKETEKIVEIAKKYGARETRVPKDMDEAMKYWKARSAGFAAVFGKAPTVFAEDVTVPRGKIPEFIRKVREIAKKYNVEYNVLGHAGDGNLHPSILTDINNKEHYERSVKALEEIIETAVELGGVLSGEHGIGLEKARFLRRTMDPMVIDIMKKIKAIFDPNNIMNPGKIWE